MAVRYGLLDRITDGVIMFFINTFCAVSWVVYKTTELLKRKRK